MSQVRQRVKELKAKAESPVGTPGTVTAILSKAVAAALIQHPRVNSHLIEQEIREYHVVHLGMAVALEDGLVVPVIRNVESKSVAAIQSELEDLIPRARSRRLHAEEMKDGTFTISNLGMFGIEQFSAILNPPEVGILSVGAIRDIPVGVEGKVVLSPMMQVTVNVDHRAVDGAVAARFLNFLKEILENPDSSLV
jgi:pyruvate dehydrogenase E2 component (dihydrolipoamide acetyltransferase)